MSVAIFAPWGCSPAPVAPVPSLSGTTFELPNGVVAIPGRLLGESDPADPGTFALSPQPYTLDTAEAKNLDEFGPFVDNITSGGGTITLYVESDTSYFTVPDEGLKSTTEIGVSVLRDPNAADARITEFHFAPEGLKFDVAAELSYRTSLKDGESLMLYWWDDETGLWMKSVEATVVKGYATFPIEHFSKYRTTERISLGGQRGSN